MKHSLIEPKDIIFISTNNLFNIPLIVTDNKNNILEMISVSKLSKSYYMIRKSIIEKIKELLEKYNINTIYLETCNLFIDKMDKYPDPLIFQNTLLKYGIKISIEDNFYYNFSYIMEIPNLEWKRTIFNKRVTYAMDLYKQHTILNRNLDQETIKLIDTNNYYEALCFSEVCLFDKFLNKKYQINE